MDFSHRKLPPEAAPTLRLCPIRTVAPFALMMAPVYVFMKKNEKFVSVKAPLDFFTPEELERLLPFESFFIPEFVDFVLPFRDAAQRVKALLSWKPKPHVQKKPVGEGKDQAGPTRAPPRPDPFPEVVLPPAPYEISDAVLRIIGPLWGPGPALEPFFITVFANELCELLPGDLLRESRDRDVEAYERGIFRSAWAVFLALHLGYCELGFLNRLRFRVFEENVKGVTPESIVVKSEIDELVLLASSTVENSKTRILKGDVFNERSGRAAQKIVGRLERVKTQFIAADAAVPSIYGAKGFIDV